MSAVWPPPPDLDSLKELFATADVEGLIADECPLDEYDPEAKHFYEATIGFSTSKFAVEQTLPILEQLAQQIARFFGPEAKPQVRQQL